ncbi:MAG: energy transducer TonB [Pyrinomonadaceae bacterium MAG19_C2-C3]|nr:energy transducer TonB [Pyrinomonadaceae bacterium MAG19_C2-C3]
MSDHEIYAHEPETSAMDDAPDAELREVLQAWRVPEVSPALDNRIYALYREASKSNLAAETLSTREAGQASIEAQGLVSAYQLSDEQKTQTGEEVKMKRCSTCQEEFADKFSFCPVDGTPLNAYQAVETPIEYDPDATIESAVAFAGAHAATTPVTNAAMTHDETANFAHYEATPATGNGNGATAHHVANDVTSNAAHVNGTHLTDAIDDETVIPYTRPERGEYHLTIIQDAGVTSRLAAELRGVAQASQLTYPEFKRDPAGFTKRVAVGYGALAWNTFKQPNIAIATVSSIFGMALIIGLIFALNSLRMNEQAAALNPNEDVEFIGMFRDVPTPEPTPEPKPDREGASGNAKGTGGGAKPQPIKAAGGGGGGREEPIPASKGKLPTATLLPQVLAPDPKPPRILNPTLPTAATIRADPVLFPPDNRPIPYGIRNGGDIASSGTGRGGGIGTGTGGGVGVGEGSGVGAGRGYNTGGGDAREGGGGASGDGFDPNKIYRTSEVTTKAIVTFKPEPGYTEEARKNMTQGTVTLRAIFNANGQVTNITVSQRLPHGLTEKAIETAKKVKFTPAKKNGRPVSQYVTMSFPFNIY